MACRPATPAPWIAALAAALVMSRAAGAAAPADPGTPAPAPIAVHVGGPSTIPFDSPSGLVIVTGRINGRAHVRLLLDTGDPSGLTLDTTVARALDLPLSDRTPTRATGVVGSERYTLYRARIRSFLLGGLSARDVTVWTAPDAGLIAGTLGIRVDGFIGVDLLRGLRVVLDYPGKRITFAPPGGPSPGPAADMPMRLEGNRLVVEAALPGGARRAMILDTAAGATFLAEADAALTGDAPAGRTTQVTDSSGTAVSLPVRILPSLAFGGIEAAQVPVVLYDFAPLNRDLFSGAAEPVAGILGSELLSRYVVVLDFPRRTFGVAAPAP